MKNFAELLFTDTYPDVREISIGGANDFTLDYLINAHFFPKINKLTWNKAHRTGFFMEIDKRTFAFVR